MSKINLITNNFKPFIRRRPRYRRALIILSMVVGGIILIPVIIASRLPDATWLPKTAKYATASDDEVLYDVPIKSENIITKYGPAARYTSSDGWQTIYEFRSNSLLKPYSCPNVANVETLLPSRCMIVGTFHYQPVYTMHRSLPSGATEYFVKLGQTFIFIKSGGDGGESLTYLNTFVSMSRNDASVYLADNSKRVDAIKAKQQAQKEATDKNNALAYTRLDFVPAIPTNLPAGWQLNTTGTNPVKIDGPDADHPNMINVEYVNSNKQYVSVHSAKLSDFAIGSQCGPSPGYSMENLACHKVAGADYYEAILSDERNDYVRYLYRPVGDCLVISHITVYADGNKRPDVPIELAKIQDAITSSAKPTDKASLKGSTYYKLYYQ